MFFNFKIKQSTEKKEKLFLSLICINSFKILYIYIKFIYTNNIHIKYTISIFPVRTVH